MFLDTLVVLRLDLPQISFKLVKNTFATQSCISNSTGGVITKVGNLVNGVGRVMGDTDWARLMIMVKD